MICRLVCAVFCVLAALAGTARAKSPVDPFADQGHITAWIAAYRDQPQPHLVPRMVQALAAQGLLHEQDRAGIYIGFVAGVLAENQVEARKLVTRMFPLPPPAQALIIKSIAYSGLPEWKELLKSLVERMPARQVLIRKYLYGKARTLEELPFDEGPKVLDTWWGYYYATGNYQPVLRIMTVLPWSSDRESVERLTVGSMAK